MSIDLGTLVPALAGLLKDAPRGRRRKHGRKLRPRRPPRAIPPTAVERRYIRELDRLLKPLPRLVTEHVIPALREIVASAPAAINPHGDSARLDKYDGEITKTIDGVRVAYERAVPDRQIKATAEATFDDLADHNREQLDRQLRAVIGVDPIASEPWLGPLIADATTANVALIKSIPSQYFDRLEATVRDGVRAGRRHEDITKEIFDRFVAMGSSDSEIEKARNRAKLIARDQVGKFNSSLSRIRQEDLGVERYEWSSARDERVRGNPAGKYPNAEFNHWERDGKIFRWDEPPPDGHPGEAIQCRCIALPILSDLLDDDAPPPPDDEGPLPIEVVPAEPEFVPEPPPPEPIPEALVAASPPSVLDAAPAPQPQAKIILRNSRGEPISEEVLRVHAERILHRPNLTPQDLASLTGLTGADVRIYVEPGQVRFSGSMELPDGSKAEAERTLSRDAAGRLRLHNDLFEITNKKAKGGGTSILAEQVRQARRLGVDYLEAYAAGSGPDVPRNSPSKFNGYITWAKLGYEGDVPADIAKETGCAKMSQLMATAEGAELWRLRGTSWNATFELGSDSKEVEALDRYIRRAHQATGQVPPKKPE